MPPTDVGEQCIPLRPQVSLCDSSPPATINLPPDPILLDRRGGVANDEISPD
ncbi:hypothetical protein Pla100_28030 [Neorhodopirellula pilleata]|uniref:Uncharacterized protein n=1 Tax=Neorhodopirellula pilleata TaxID=2714738 RepID=A0A5C6AA57_9BACT|nr:hypothetical protein Pla100_28030 [Neorhodopirellula pilleata]